MVAKKLSAPNVTKTRLLDATEALFIKYGYDAVLLRQITERAQVNLAAVNYHFGDKDSLMKTLLMQRLEPLNEQRLELLARCEAEADGPLDCDTLLGVLFAPAMGLERSDPASGEGRSFIRFLGRVYSDTSPFIQEYLKVHYQPVFQRFFEAFALALPDLPRNELGVRLQFALKAISGVMAGTELRLLMNSMSLGRPATDAEVMAKLITLVSAAIRVPQQSPEAETALAKVLDTQRAIREQAATPATKTAR
ncbi:MULTISPECIES: TetR/AcrR family transcriptional regulator [Pseudomonas]|uniref:TetR family transcriptional regulator n=2 Tax=Pseudomonas TaxID=286 RepID=A0A0W0HG17_PSEFL|nr:MULTISPECIES: TetR/AcrR family transcriptional regulator [Pseudomonas]KQM54115.1 TetR family transcriptional regulator [Pseudomonas sp. Leaf15]KTB59846.1 TetR family transcriptional regulator [Pseudomonas fluorescens ICMP 11288]MCF5547000.1 TetR family transcriptional regulator [Pseudomonas salomonii]MDQ0703236.1 AcrR family transcriptional regulator [Pseudomonas sp. W3I7]RAG99512.1 TetR/AcrR family transcriptional regulator [Pseudomonas sp. Leaf98]